MESPGCCEPLEMSDEKGATWALPSASGTSVMARTSTGPGSSPTSKGAVLPGTMSSRGCADTAPPRRRRRPRAPPRPVLRRVVSSSLGRNVGRVHHACSARAASTLARAYLITQEQFVEVVRQENGNRPKSTTSTQARGSPAARARADAGHRRLHRAHLLRRTRRPSHAQLHRLGESKGLQAPLGGLSPGDRDRPEGMSRPARPRGRRVPGGRPGVRGTWTHGQLLDILTTASPQPLPRRRTESRLRAGSGVQRAQGRPLFKRGQGPASASGDVPPPRSAAAWSG